MSSQFAETYRAVILPRLKQRFPISAALIVGGASPFSVEVATLSRTAWRLGGSHIAPNLWAGLEEWIEAQVLDAVTQLELRQTIPGAHRDILAVFAEQEREMAALTEENERLRASLTAAWEAAADAQGVPA
jgi:hypothetical protein